MTGPKVSSSNGEPIGGTSLSRVGRKKEPWFSGEAAGNRGDSPPVTMRLP